MPSRVPPTVKSVSCQMRFLSMRTRPRGSVTCTATLRRELKLGLPSGPNTSSAPATSSFNTLLICKRVPASRRGGGVRAELGVTELGSTHEQLQGVCLPLMYDWCKRMRVILRVRVA